MAIEEAAQTLNGLCHAGRARLDALKDDVMENRANIAALAVEVRANSTEARRQYNWITAGIVTTLLALLANLLQMRYGG